MKGEWCSVKSGKVYGDICGVCVGVVEVECEGEGGARLKVEGLR